MQESPFPFIEHLRKQGSREMVINNILSVLTERFPLSDVQPIEQALESILDLERLTELLRTAVRTSSVETFLQGLEASEV